MKKWPFSCLGSRESCVILVFSQIMDKSFEDYEENYLKQLEERKNSDKIQT